MMTNIHSNTRSPTYDSLTHRILSSNWTLTTTNEEWTYAVNITGTKGGKVADVMTSDYVCIWAKNKEL
jgi:hypothetical protein